mgnify:CR=1 FL=1
MIIANPRGLRFPVGHHEAGRTGGVAGMFTVGLGLLGATACSIGADPDAHGPSLGWAGDEPLREVRITEVRGDSLLDWRTVQKNVELPLEIMGIDDRTGATRMLDLVQLGQHTGLQSHSLEVIGRS